MQKLLQLLGFYGEGDNEDEYSGYEEEFPRPTGKKSKSGRKDEPRGQPIPPKLVLFKGIPSEEIRFKLRDALLDGVMVLLDLTGLESERIEEGRTFINFMGGVAFAHRGVMHRIGPSLFIIEPYEGMFQWWGE